MQIQSCRSDKAKKVGQGVNKAFNDVRIFALPRPGEDVTRASERDKTLTFSRKFFSFRLY